MKTVTWILRILSTLAFIAMCWIVYNIMSGLWDWDAPYVFIVTVFRLISMVLFFVASIVMSGLVAGVTGSQPGPLIVGLYNTLVLRGWYLQPFGVSGPFTSVEAVFQNFIGNLLSIWQILQVNTFIFIYFLFAALGVALFLQSMVRMNHKFVGGSFLAIQGILVISAFAEFLVSRGIITAPILATVDIPNFEIFPTDIFVFLTSSPQILAVVSFAYLEFSYQMLYSDSVGKPVEEREETLKKQLLALRQETKKQDAIERDEKLRTTGMSRVSGATAFSFLREAIERKVLGRKDAIENLDVISDVRRLQIFVDQLLKSNPEAKNNLTASAAAPSESYVIGSTILGSAIRFAGVITLSFVFMNPAFFISFFKLPPGIQNSVEIAQPELVVFFLLPILLLFPLAAMIIVLFTKEEISAVEEQKEMTRESMIQKIPKRKRRDAKSGRESEVEGDEWDQALEKEFKR
ncbi:hypothetical protein EU537_07670 [Candidatus Thorarchaeota archaeon]|nr:MAG: hypothetical protein EU537_07670 [Candidatus Thorarchaeota archaeon]